MGKVHTHYDNLKVARAAPQEVIRAAYKVLSQKYHPDKNPGDDKAARVMALLNNAYGTLADPQRRKEHDDWIAAEEWEVERAEHQDGSRRRPETGGRGKVAPVRQASRRGWKWWCSLAACFGLGGVGGMLMQSKFKLMPATLALAWGDAGAEAAPVRPASGIVIRALPKIEPEPMATPAPAPAPVAAPEVKVAAVSHVILPTVPPLCDDVSAPLAPNGEAWPQQSGHLAGLPFSNKGTDMQLTVDNAGNAAPVLVKLFDLERRSNVRYLFVLARDKVTIDQLAFGKYEVRYQKIDLSGTAGEGCGNLRAAAANVQ